MEQPNYKDNFYLSKRLFKEYVLPHKIRFFFSIFLMIIVAATTAGHAYMVKPALDEVFVRGSKVKAIIQCVGLWISSGNYNCQWKLVRCQVDVPKTGSNDFLPDSDSEDEN